jgi:hypothetical protein
MDRRRGRYRIDYHQDSGNRPPTVGPPGDADGPDRPDVRTSDSFAGTSRTGSIVILIPVFNDWDSLARLLHRLDAVMAAHDRTADILVVDDGSTIEPEADWQEDAFDALERIDILRLRRNLGHQRAIAIGLAYIEDCLQSRAVVVMDGDGEDDPRDVPRLLDQLEEDGYRRIVFAERTKRSESFRFKVFYALYKVVHRLLTGQNVRVGNFSAIPRRRLSSLVVVTELWNHYAAAVVRSRQPHQSIPTHRSERLCGRSKMSFVALVTHGLSAISVHSDTVGVRLLVTSAILALLVLGGIVAAIVVRLATSLAIPGWATNTIGLLMILLVQAMMAAFIFSFMVLGSRHGSPFLPRRDYSYYIETVRTMSGLDQPITPLPLPEGDGVFSR